MENKERNNVCFVARLSEPVLIPEGVFIPKRMEWAIDYKGNELLLTVESSFHGDIIGKYRYNDIDIDEGEIAKIYNDTPVSNLKHKDLLFFDSLIDEMLMAYNNKYKRNFDSVEPPHDFKYRFVGQSNMTEGEEVVVECWDIEEFDMGGLWRFDGLIEKKLVTLVTIIMK